MIMKTYKILWDNFDGKKFDGRGYPSVSKRVFLNYFARYIIEDLGYHNDKSFKRRCEYEENYKWYHSLVKYPDCFICGKKAKLRHHIIGLVKGGTNHRLNFVSLCKNCHIKVHKKINKYKYEKDN